MTVTALAAALVLACAPAEMPLGTEKFGNEPVGNQTEWADGVLAAANHTSRVYQRWVNGNEDFCYRGDAKKMNAVIAGFSKIKDDKKFVVLMPTRGLTHSFKKIEIKHDLRMHVPSGIYLAMAKRETEFPVMATHPTLTIHLGGDLKLDDLEIPKEVPVIGSKELVGRYRAGLLSTTKGTRGQACYLLKDFGWFPGVIADIEKVLAGDDSWMTLNALSAVAGMGKDGVTLVPAIKELKESTDDDRTKKSCDRALEAIEKAAAPKTDSRPAVEKTIRLWIKARTQGKEK